jgi:hypothetical protein
LRLNERRAHWLLRKLDIFDGFHDWLEGFCPCDHEDVQDAAA